MDKIIAKMDMEAFRQMKDLEYKVDQLEKELAEYRWSVGQVSRAISSANGEIGIAERDSWVNFWRCLDALMVVYQKFQNPDE
jgi:hypothetical protein